MTEPVEFVHRIVIGVAESIERERLQRHNCRMENPGHALSPCFRVIDPSR
jgi:hypothetical protein